MSKGMVDLTALDVFIRLSAAALLGAIIGFERQWRHKPAGVHTTGLVAVGSALFAMLDLILKSGDSTRIMAGVVTGVGFIAGAVMFRSGFSIKGLNTAATIWATAAIGGLVGFDLWPEAVGGAIAIVLLNGLLEPVSDALDKRAHHDDAGETSYKITVRGTLDNQSAVGDAIRASVDKPPFKLLSFSRHRVDGTLVDVAAEVVASTQADEAVEALCGRLLALENVLRADWSSER
jgi:putative Mg2+ transporter-C (MgtC) family protein